MELYYGEISGNSRKVRLFLSLIGGQATLRPLDLAAGEQREEGYRALNPFGQAAASARCV
ncbi:hypothetical protein [Chelativorans sp. M5D2P16]|uniref:hypothetical protein n=1 Tax=Chelativorans sp. M5D2P16 TaxID=3095678 RepID=UPI002ACA0885|nr:hypothetical protein [Chelativorans sp. M5D2P16]MDZ5697468.1 hypothetical protein [Chelativorans sp. M5D2P16]